MERKKLMIFITALIIVVIAGLGIIFFASKKAGAPVATNDGSANSENGQVAGTTTQHDAAWIEGLAKDLSKKGMVMYGASWCGHCKKQKEAFGDAVKYIDYVECDAATSGSNPDECTAKKVEGYPTWIYQDKQYSGEQSLDKLAEIVGYVGN